MIADQDIEALLADRTKQVQGDIAWRVDRDRPSTFIFRMPVLSKSNRPLEIFGRWEPGRGKLSYLLLYSGVGRIYALDMGVSHRNPGGEFLEGLHKHRWTAEFRDGLAYEPSDITAPWDEPVRVWEQFCAEAHIIHLGTLHEPQAAGKAQS